MPSPAQYREVAATDFPNTGRDRWNLTDSEVVVLANYCLDHIDEVYRGATSPATPHNYKFWVSTATTPAKTYEWDGAGWNLTNQGPAGRGFTWRGVWASGTLYTADGSNYDVFAYNGATYVTTVTHTSDAASPPPNANVALVAASGAAGGAHGSTHVSTGSDPVPNVVAGGASGLMSGADKTKLDGVEAGATADMTALEIRGALVTVDGPGSGISADLLDDLDASAFEQRSSKDVASGYAGLDSGGLIAPARLGTGAASGAAYLAGDRTWQAFPAPGYTPTFARQTGAGSVYGAWADGDPERVVRLIENGVSIQSNNFGTAIAHIVSFRLPVDLTLSAVRMWTLRVQAGHASLAIYRHSDGVRVWQSGALDTVLDDWANATANMPVSLAKDTRYWMCLASALATANPVYRTAIPNALGTNFYGADTSFIAGGGKGVAIPAQIAVTSGSFPATMPAIAAAAYSGSAGGPPACFLVGTPS